MKRMLSLILVSVMLLATVFMCKVDAKAAEVEKLPFYLSNWEDMDSEEYPNLWGKPYLWATRNEDTITVNYHGTTVSDIAAALKETFEEYPENSGMRIINFVVVIRRHLIEMIEDYVFMDSAAEKLESWTREFLAEYKRIGGELDGLYSDLEYMDGLYWELYVDQFQNDNTEVYYQITQNPSYQTKLRPMLEERGFQFYPKPLDTMPEGLKKTYCELYSLNPNSGAKFQQSRRIWDVVVQNMWNQYMNESVFEPLQEYFPDAMFMDYKNKDGYGWMKATNENNYDVYIGGNTIKVGTHSANNMYNYCPEFVTESESATSYIKPVSHIDAVYEDSPFHNALWEINSFKNMLLASEDNKLYVDSTSFDYGQNYGTFKDEHSGTASGTAYHAEEYFHLGLMNVVFGGYFIATESASSSDFDYKQQVVSEILNELTRVAGYADRKPIELPATWNDSFILSGMYANGRNIWRITPDNSEGMTKKKFLSGTEGGQIVFKNKGQTITFPQGTIIEDADISAIGTCGYWVETPADVMPIVTNDANRFVKYPAYSETFSGYKEGMTFNYKNAQHTHVWETFLQNGATATVEVNPSNDKDKVLAISGSGVLSNVKVPSYITAGDTYAKQQVWQISFSLPTLPSGSAEAVLLNTTAASGAVVEDGFRIYDGKIYYGTAAGYIPFENVTLAASTEYTLKRTLDFQNEEQLIGSYYVYDASGNLLDKAENVSLAKLKVSVEKISFSTAEFDDTLYLDDYKLYAIGIGVDFEVYNANTGIQVADPTAAQNNDAAYRLSWMNNSGATATYNVVATYSDGTKEVVETVVMKPGYDAVNTGIVKANGKGVTLSIELVSTEGDVNAPGTDENPGNEGGSDQGGAQGNGKGGMTNTALLIVLICLAVVLAGIVVTIVLLPTIMNPKKKNNAAPSAEAEDPTE